MNLNSLKHSKRRKKKSRKTDRKSLATKYLQQLLIGQNITIIDYFLSDPQNHEGTVIDETRNMVILLSEGKEKKFPKSRIKLIIRDQETKKFIEIEGKLLLGRPEERLKTMVRKMW